MENMIEVDTIETLKQANDELRAVINVLSAQLDSSYEVIDKLKDEVEKYHTLSDLMTGGKIKAEKRMMDMQARCSKKIKAADDWVNTKETWTMLSGMIIGFVTCGIVSLLIFTHLRGWW